MLMVMMMQPLIVALSLQAAGGQCSATQPRVTQLKVPALRLYDEQSTPAGTLSGSSLPAMPLAISGVNDRGFLGVVIAGRTVFVRSSDVNHNMCYCTGSSDERRAEGITMAAGTPGIRKGAASGSGECIPRG